MSCGTNIPLASPPLPFLPTPQPLLPAFQERPHCPPPPPPTYIPSINNTRKERHVLDSGCTTSLCGTHSPGAGSPDARVDYRLWGF